MNLAARRTASWAFLTVCCALTPGYILLLAKNVQAAGDNGRLVDAGLEVGLLVFPVVGTLICTYRPDNTLGLLFGLGGLVWIAEGFFGEYARFALITDPGVIAGGELAAWMSNWLWVPEIGILATFSLLLFPTGHLPGPRWRFVAWTAATGMVVASFGSAFAPGKLENFPSEVVQNPFGLDGAKAALATMTFAGVLLVALAAIASVASLFMRMRKAGGVERQQLKWFAYAAGLLALAFIITFIGYMVSAQAVAYSLVTIFGLPIAAGIAILRYRLYDIDFIINRTLVYATLTASLAGLYAASVQLFKFLFEAVAGKGSDATIVLTTLVLAALFTPLKNRLQKSVDHYFGQVHDPAKELKSYSEQLRSVVRVFDPRETARQFLDHAVQAFEASGGSLYVEEGGRAICLAEVGGLGEPRVRVEMLSLGEPIGFFTLSARKDSSDYNAEDLGILEATGSLVADAIVLARKTSPVSLTATGANSGVR